MDEGGDAQGNGIGVGPCLSRGVSFWNIMLFVIAGLRYAKRPLPLGLPRPRSYNHLLFSPTLARPVPVTGVGVLGNPPLPLPLSKLSLRDVLPLNAFCTNGLPL